jgi:hypothetical protein
MIRQHARDPTKSTRRYGFEGGFFSSLKSAFAELLRRIIRGGGRGEGLGTLSCSGSSGGAERGGVSTPSRDPKGRALMSLHELGTNHHEEELQRALHLNLMEEERASSGRERQRCPEP